MGKSKGVKRKPDNFNIHFRNYIRNSIQNNTKRNLLEAKGQDDKYNEQLEQHLTVFPNTNQTIIGGYLFTLLYQARHEREAYGRYRIETLNTIYQFVAENKAWYDLWHSIVLMEYALFSKQQILSNQLSTELLDLFRSYSSYPKWPHGLTKTGELILKTPPFYITKPVLTYIERPEAVGRKKGRKLESGQFLSMEYASYLSMAYGLYREDTLDLIAENALPYDLIPELTMPRQLADLNGWAELVLQERKYTMNRFGVVVDCYNTGDIDQVVMVEQEGFLIWKVHFKKPGWTLDSKGELVSDLRGAEYCGYFTPEILPRSLFTVHTDFLEFEYQLYDFVLECYADIVCGADVVNNKFGRKAVNMGTVSETSSVTEGDVVGFRYTPRTVYSNAKKNTSNLEDFEEEIKKYFISGHIRKLPEGHKASLEAVTMAAEYGIDLPDGHTFVRPYESGEEKIRTHYVKRL